MALHRETKPPSFSSSVRDVDPVVERVVQSCLSRNPADRPASARMVLAALPGGDPLQAAIAAGETPSPAMVAAAGKVGDLRAGVAWAALLSGLAGMVLIAFLAGSTRVIGKVLPEKSPEVLAEKARELVAKLGYSDPPADTWSSFDFDIAYLEYAAKNDASSNRWEKLDAVRPGPLLFHFRQSPRKLVARQLIRTMGPSEVGRITPDDPPVDVPGMASVVLDRRGWLTGFRAVPPQLDSTPARDPDWSLLLAAAGLDGGELTATPPRWAAPVDSDRKAAWDGAYPGQPEVPIHVEAAAYHGKPVWFEVQGPWVQPVSKTLPGEWILILIFLLVGGPVFVLAGVLVRRNVRLGRWDRKGSRRLLVFLFLSMTLAGILRTDHVASLLDEPFLVIDIVAQAIFFAILLWTEYVALEPIARRRFPDLLISWSRLLEGRFRDPLVGRDVLVGGCAGVTLALVVHLSVVAPSWFGHLPGAPIGRVITTLSASRHLAHFYFMMPSITVGVGLGSFLFMSITRSVFRNRWFALGLQAPFTYAVISLGIGLTTASSWVAIALFTIIWLAVLVRAGFVAAGVSLWFYLLLNATPMTRDLSSWYAGRMVVSLLVLAAMLVYGFLVSLGGKPLFARPLLESDGEA